MTTPKLDMEQARAAAERGSCGHPATADERWNLAEKLTAALDRVEELERECAVADEVFEYGHWSSCSGCHESNEGHSTGPWSDRLRCNLGSGCHECGGIGAVWDQHDAAKGAP